MLLDAANRTKLRSAKATPTTSTRQLDDAHGDPPVERVLGSHPSGAELPSGARFTIAATSGATSQSSRPEPGVDPGQDARTRSSRLGAGRSQVKSCLPDLREGEKEHADMLEWLGVESAEDFDPTAFDVDRVNALLSVRPEYRRPAWHGTKRTSSMR
jgi:hypothetical protein